MDLSKLTRDTCINGAGYLTISTRHSPLHYNRLFALPSVQHRHPSNWGAFLKSNRVDRVVRTNNERQISVLEVIVYLLHFQHDYSTG